MDRNVHQTDMPLVLETEYNDELNKTVTTASLDLNGLHNTWTPAFIIRLSTFSLLMLLTLLGNSIVIITIVSCAELRKKRVNIFILNLAVGDLTVCTVSMPFYMLGMVGQWALGPVACKLTGYVFIVSVSFSIFLLTAMSIDRYQVRVIMYSVFSAIVQ